MIDLPAENKRLLSLDVFRGLTIVLMILVNSQSTPHPYALLEHADWNGCTFADLVFPSFLFIVGVTTVISFKKYEVQINENRYALYKSIVQRSCLLFGLGLFLNAFPFHFDFATIRVYGILQRIAVCYLISSIIYLNSSTKTQVLIFLGLLWLYWVVMTLIPVPGHGANQLSPEGSWVSFIDQNIFSMPHLFAKIYDPEGFLTTFPSIATTLFGVLTGTLLLKPITLVRKAQVMIVVGFISLLLGWLWSFSFPLNKNLWTSSFVLWTSGISLLSFAVCYVVIDIWGYKRWALPLKIFGVNALFAFTVHVLLLKIQAMFIIRLPDGVGVNIKVWFTQYFFGSFSEQNAALFYALGFIVLNFILVAYLYHRRIFIKI